jgi:SAM-dependent methyltransferase
MPKVSVFTPTNDSQYLDAAYQSLGKQSFQDWEWVVVPNGGVRLPSRIWGDHRARVVPAPDAMGAVGALKRYAAAQCRGDILVELDHDDMLREDALARIVEAFEGGAGFVYSDFVEFREDGSSHVYDPAFGWSSYPVRWNGEDYVAMRAFEPSAATLASIHYAPNHVRAWGRKVYWAVGGHDPALPVCDDYDLVVRTYLAGVPFTCIHEPLYFYRLRADGGNTYLQRNAEIQARNAALRAKYLDAILEQDCARRQLRKIDLGGAHNAPAGFETVDLRDADICCDITQGLPFRGGSVGWVRAYDFLEHIPPASVPFVMNEIHRVLAPGGWLRSATPSTDGRGAFQDPTHVSFWNPNSFWYYTDPNYMKYVPAFSGRFRAEMVVQSFPTPWHEANNIPYVYADLSAMK